MDSRPDKEKARDLSPWPVFRTMVAFGADASDWLLAIGCQRLPSDGICRRSSRVANAYRYGIRLLAPAAAVAGVTAGMALATLGTICVAQTNDPDVVGATLAAVVAVTDVAVAAVT